LVLALAAALLVQFLSPVLELVLPLALKLLLHLVLKLAVELSPRLVLLLLQLLAMPEPLQIALGVEPAVRALRRMSLAELLSLGHQVWAVVSRLSLAALEFQARCSKKDGVHGRLAEAALIGLH